MGLFGSKNNCNHVIIPPGNYCCICGKQLNGKECGKAFKKAVIQKGNVMMCTRCSSFSENTDRYCSLCGEAVILEGKHSFINFDEKKENPVLIKLAEQMKVDEKTAERLVEKGLVEAFYYKRTIEVSDKESGKTGRFTFEGRDSKNDIIEKLKKEGFFAFGKYDPAMTSELVFGEYDIPAMTSEMVFCEYEGEMLIVRDDSVMYCLYGCPNANDTELNMNPEKAKTEVVKFYEE